MEGKKVLWVVFSIALALVVILAAGLFLLRPRQPASAAQVRPGAAPSLQGYDPYEYVRGTSAPPGLTPPPAESEPVVIVVGEPPGSQPPAQPVESAIAPLESPRERASAIPAPVAQSAAKSERPSAPQERAPQERATAPHRYRHREAGGAGCCQTGRQAGRQTEVRECDRILDPGRLLLQRLAG